MNKPFGIIYKATNVINGQCYIGQTTQSFKKRKRDHLKLARGGHGYKFHQAIKKFGEKMFEWVILCECSCVLELENNELYFMMLYDSVSNGYNDRYSNSTITDETREKISKANKGRKISEEIKKHLSDAAKKNWIENRENHIIGIKNRQYYGDKISEIKKKGIKNGTLNLPMLGKHHTDTTKKKISDKAKIRNVGEGNPMYGRKHSDETKEKIRQKALMRYK